MSAIKNIETASKAWKDKLKRSKKTFGRLCLALAELNHIFSFPAFVFLTIGMISSIVCLYITIYGLISDNEFFEKLVPTTTLTFLVGLVFILIVCFAAELPMSQVGLTINS